MNKRCEKHDMLEGTCVLCKELQEERKAYIYLQNGVKDKINLPDPMNKGEVVRWYRRVI